MVAGLAGRHKAGSAQLSVSLLCRALQLGIKQPHYFATHQPEWSNQHPASRSGQVRSTRYLDIQMRIRPQLWKLTDGSEVTVR